MKEKTNHSLNPKELVKLSLIVMTLILSLLFISSPVYSLTCPSEELIYSHRLSTGTAYGAHQGRNVSNIIEINGTTARIITKVQVRFSDEGCDTPQFIDLTLRNATHQPTNTDVAPIGKYICDGTDEELWVNFTVAIPFIVRENTNYTLFMNGSGLNPNQMGIQDQWASGYTRVYTQEGGGEGAWTLRNSRKGNIEVYGCDYVANIPPSFDNSTSPAAINPRDSFDCGIIPRDVNNDPVNVSLVHFFNDGTGWVLNETYNKTWTNPALNVSINTSSTNGRWEGFSNNNWTFKCQWNVTDGTDTVLLNTSIIAVNNVTIYDHFALASDRSRVLLSNIAEDREFFLFANHTINNVSIGGSVCNWTVKNITAHFVQNNGTSNYTLTTFDQNLSISVSEGVTNLVNDTYSFRICRENAAKSAGVYWNGTLINTINPAVIPACDVGFHTEIVETDLFNSFANINLTVICNACVGIHKLRIVPNTEGDLLLFERSFSSHSEGMTYNVTSKLYEYISHPYEYLSSGVQGNITYFCNVSSNEYIFNVSDKGLNVSILSIDGVAYTAGMQIESLENNSILINVFGDVIERISFNVTNSTGTVLNSTTGEHLLLNKSLMPRNGIYNISIAAIDNDGNVTLKTGYFQLNDTVKPAITFINPIIDNLTSINTFVSTNLSLQITFQDTNLFGFDVNVTKPDGTLFKNFNLTDINQSTYTLSELVSGIITSGVWEVHAVAWDDHTIEEWDVPHEIVGNDLYFTFPPTVGYYENETKLNNVSFIYTAGDDVTQLLVGCKKDRCGFAYRFAEQKVNDIVLRLHCEGLAIRRESKHNGHVVCNGVKAWVDFDSEDVDRYRYRRCGVDCLEIAARTNPDTRWLKFESIGGLNFQNASAAFTVSNFEPASNTTLVFLDECPNSVPSVMILILMFVMLAFFIVIGIVILNPAIGLFSGIALIMYGVVLWQCFWVVSVICILAGGLIAVTFMTMPLFHR